MNITRESRKLRERAVFVIYAVYTAAMLAAACVNGWNGVVPFVIIGAFVISAAVFFTKFKSYFFRASVISVMLWVNLFVYFIGTGKDFPFAASLCVVAATIILIGVYCIPKLCFLSAAAYTLYLLYHLILPKDIVLGLDRGGMQSILCIVSVYVVVVITYRLIAGQVKSNIAMLEKIEEAGRAERSKDDFLSNISHEIRTPINTVCGLSEMLLREELPENLWNGIYDIQTAGRQLLSLVSDILDFTELSSGRMEIIPDEYNITSTVNDILNIAIANMKNKNVEIIVDCDSDIPRGLVGDEPKIRRAVLNILDNAIKYTEEGGIRLSFSFRKGEDGGNLRVSVKDTGIGIKKEMLEKVFEHFGQSDTKRNRKNSGVGLGMSIAKAIVNKMGGFISVDSEYGKGTEVKMVFPQKISDERPIVQLDNMNECKTLLYLDVEKYNNSFVRDGYRTMVVHMAENLKIPYHQVKNLAECRGRLARGKYDYLFMAWKEYCEDRQYFEKLSESMKVVLVLERNHKESVAGSNLLCVYKPIYSLVIASVLNGHYADYAGRNAAKGIRFTAPDAKVLVVDDNLMNLRVAEGLLRPYRLKMFFAESGKEALEKIKEERFDLIMMDHMMPEMDGVETFHKIRGMQGSYYKEVPVVALTANAVGGAREMFLEEGFADYVSKPIEMSSLDRVLGKFIPEEKKRKDGQTYEEETAKTQDGWSQVTREVGVDNDNDVNAENESAHDNADNAIVLAGINTSLGMQYCGNTLSDYLEILRTYAIIGRTKKEDIVTYYKNKDWKNYTINVHAVKSTSLSIGAEKLSEMAKALEHAGKNDDVDYIDANTEEMLVEYGRVLSVIEANEIVFPHGGADEKTSDLGNMDAISKDELTEKLLEINELLDTFNQGRCVDGIEGLYTYKYGDKPLRELLSGVLGEVNNFNFMGAQEELEKLIEGLDGLMDGLDGHMEGQV